MLLSSVSNISQCKNMYFFFTLVNNLMCDFLLFSG